MSLRVLIYAAVLMSGCARRQPPLEVLGTVPDFTLTAHSGSPFESAMELRGRIWAANFVFTNCTGPCPRMTSQMRRVQDETETIADVRMVTFTVDPARDTPKVLGEYATRQHAGKRWFFLTGTMEALHKLKREAFLLGNIDGELNHSTRFVLVDKESRIRAYYDTSEPDSIARLVSDIRRLSHQ